MKHCSPIISPFSKTYKVKIKKNLGYSDTKK